MRQLVVQQRGPRAASGRFVRAVSVASVALMVLASNVSAATDYHLLKNIRAGSASSSPSWFTAMTTYVLFFADDGTTPHHGMELWRSDGTRANTRLVKDVNQGSAPGIPGDAEMIRLGDIALFAATDGTNGVELWRTNGTPTGTQMVRNIFPGGDGSHPHQFMRAGARVFFVVTNGTHGDELWVTNGTHNGTKKASSIDPTGPVEISDDFAAFDGGLAFSADDGHTGMEPWFSDGSPTGTRQLQDINSSFNASSQPFGYTVVAGHLYFSATDSTHGDQLWEYDPGAANPTRLPIHGDTDARVGGLVRVGNTLYFQATDAKGAELWRADGSTVKRVKDINPLAGSSNPTEMIGINGTIYFHADDGTHGNELWMSDGTAAHTVMVKNVFPDAQDDGGSHPAYLRNVAGVLMYEARDGSHGYSLWRSDGSVNGTHMVKDIAPGPANFGFNGELVMGRFLFVLGDDGVHGEEIWQSDGSKGGTFVLDINPGADSSNVGFANKANGAFYIEADDGTHGSEPWIVTP